MTSIARQQPNDPREVVTDPSARYLNTLLTECEHLPGNDALIFETRFVDWLARSAPAK